MNKCVFLTGATGVFGKWLVPYALCHKYHVTSLSRSSQPLTVDPQFIQIQGDIRDFTFPNQEIDLIIHGASTTDKQALEENPELFLEICERGTAHILNLAASNPGCRLLLISSGAVLPDRHTSIYSEGKRKAEELALAAFHQVGTSVMIARCFAFSGEHIPLDKNYAFGNFIGRCLRNEDIVIESDGQAVRSYLDGKDLARWLFAIAEKGQAGEIYEVGSSHGLSILQLAKLVAKVWNESPEFAPNRKRQVEVKTLNQFSGSADIYVPTNLDKTLALGLREDVDLRNSVLSALRFHLEKYPRT